MLLFFSKIVALSSKAVVRIEPVKSTNSTGTINLFADSFTSKEQAGHIVKDAQAFLHLRFGHAS
jgi:hypothetical protein